MKPTITLWNSNDKGSPLTVRSLFDELIKSKSLSDDNRFRIVVPLEDRL